ncbi:MAG TPA: MqnA/MqnD/SBP family protein, partial [Acidobacteriota bacterium]
ALLPHGASIGDRYGPIVVSQREIPIHDLKRCKIGVPGELTTAFLALKLCLGDFQYEVIPFDQIFTAVQSGKTDAGLIIHEGQLTYERLGFTKVLDLGEWWFERTSLPLPLGVNVVRKDLGTAVCREISEYLKQSIEYGLNNRQEAMQYALRYSRNTEESLADRFVAMYVNHYTQNLGERGLHAVRRLMDEAHNAKLIPETSIDVI